MKIQWKTNVYIKVMLPNKITTMIIIIMQTLDISDEVIANMQKTVLSLKVMVQNTTDVKYTETLNADLNKLVPVAASVLKALEGLVVMPPQEEEINSNAGKKGKVSVEVNVRIKIRYQDEGKHKCAYKDKDDDKDKGTQQ